jgi:hypothetical protein
LFFIHKHHGVVIGRVLIEFTAFPFLMLFKASFLQHKGKSDFVPVLNNPQNVLLENVSKQTKWSVMEDSMRKHCWSVLFILVLLYIGCSGIRVSQDYDPSTDFDALKTYQWKSKSQDTTGDPRIDNPLRDERIRNAIELVLEGKGFDLAQDSTPSFHIAYQAILRRRIESSGTTGTVGFGVGTYGRRGGVAIGTGTEVREVEEGSLIIDVMDPESGALLWRGTGNQRYREYTDPQKASRDINALVGKILEQFPPKRK